MKFAVVIKVNANLKAQKYSGANSVLGEKCTYLLTYFALQPISG
jgi:hypothetical protein